MKKTIYTLSTAAVLTSIFATSAFAAETSYKVKSGDSLSKIASTNSTTISKLKTLNKLSSDMIYVNQVLLVNNGTSTSTSTKTNESKSATTYTVISGDNLSKIANKFGITLSKLKSLNNLNSNAIYPGNKLIVSSAAGSVTTSVSTSASKSTAPASNQTSGSYTVKSGDSLWKVANAHGTTVANLKTINKLSSTTIQPGQVLKLSGSAQTTSSSSGSTTTTASKKQTSSTSYTVVRGDTLSKIASKYNVTVSQLKKINNLSSDFLSLGQSIKITGSSNSVSQTTNVTKPTSSSDTKVANVISLAKSFIGTPYSWAGSAPGGFDCSGFIYYVYKKAGYQISRVSSSTYFDMGKSVKNPEAGDLIFFDTTTNSKAIISHMGIYLGNGQFIHASSSKGVTITSTNDSYFKNRIMGYRSL